MLGSFARKVIVCTIMVRDETFRNAKNMRIKHSVSSSPTKYGETFFRKKGFPSGNRLFWANLWGDLLHAD